MLIAMVYMSAYGYANGNLSKPFRATDSSGNVCGDPNGVAANYPYAYFYNPTSGDLSKRYCVKTCPYFDSTSTLTTIECYGQSSCTYAVTITSSGAYTSNPSSTSVIIGYETSSLISRVCVPSSTVFSGVFSSYVTVFSTYLSQSGFSTFITDLQNVQIYQFRTGNGFFLVSASQLPFRLSSCTHSNALQDCWFGSPLLVSLSVSPWLVLSSSTTLVSL